LGFFSPKQPILKPVALASWGANRLDVLTVDESNGVRHRFWNGSAWSSAATALSSRPTGSAAVVTLGTGKLDAFVVDRQNQLRHSTYRSSIWNIDTNFPSLSDATGDPVALSDGISRIHVFYRTTAGALTHLYYNGIWFTERLPSVSMR